MLSQHVQMSPIIETYCVHLFLVVVVIIIINIINNKFHKLPQWPSLPCIISFTVSLSVPDEASARLIQILVALCTLEAGCMPLQVRGNSQDVLVVYLTSTPHAHCDSRLLYEKETH